MRWLEMIEAECRRLTDMKETLRSVEVAEPETLYIPVDILDNRMDAADFIVSNIPPVTQNFLYTIHINPGIDVALLEHYYPTIQYHLKLRNRHLSSINNGHSDTCLIIGGRRSNLRNIVMQHLGFGADRSFSLKLSDWYNDYCESEIILRWYNVFSEDNRVAMPLLEKALWDKLKPLFGKRPL